MGRAPQTLEADMAPITSVPYDSQPEETSSRNSRVTCPSPSAPSQQSSSNLPKTRIILGTGQSEWSLPLESLVLDTRDNDIPLNFLRIYPTILRKFKGPPCEALA